MRKFSARVFSLWLIILMMMVGCVILVRCDFAQDKKECQDQLIGLSPCISFISEEEKSPSPVCCLKLGINFEQKRKCMCMLVRDRNDPGVGFKINATLALSLPFICHIPSNETECLDFLHLDPQSPEAQVFKQFSNSNSSGSSSITTANGNSESSSSTVRGKGWINLVMVGGISIWLLMHVHFHN
ncbi:hypothetical protein ACH5RR_007486 [Cinchona calisaya]|uniref:Bifunctional inhibitor/plant lipid transfer protein/seed storage helical domain-containing protein n=1 Tax=Cinchona calisaya TaxID=153742 RepID=A0ABD3ARZ7_9GENT